MSLLAPPNPWESVLEWAAPASAVALEQYYWDPVGFARDCIEWPEGQELTEYQAEGLQAIVDHHRVSIRSMHGAGKSTYVAIAILWFALTRDAMGKDWKCPVTAGAWRQLEKYLWPEIHKWAQRIRWSYIERRAFKSTELQRTSLRLRFGEAIALASDNHVMIEGAHADCIMYVFDESKAISTETFDAAEGAFTGEGSDTLEALALSTSTPGEPVGRFYDIQQQSTGNEDWHPLHWTLERVMAAGRVTQKFVDKHKRLWGETSALFANRVLGEFHSADEDGVIPLTWIEKAIARYEARQDQRAESLGPMDALGVDVARQGEDRSAFAKRYGMRVQNVVTEHYGDTMETTGHVVGILRANPTARAVIDTDGLGAGVTDRTREQGFDAFAFHAGETKGIENLTDRSGELAFANKKAAAWWRLREMLDPAYGSEVELPNDAELLGDLCAPKWKVLSNGRIQVEKKEDVKKRIGRSTDKGDAVVHSFWEERKRRRARMGNMGVTEGEEEAA